MDFNLPSMLSACIIVTFLIILLCPLLKAGGVLRKIGPRCVIVIFLFMVVRMLVPLEVWWFDYDVKGTRLLPMIMDVLNYEVFSAPYTIAVWHILLAVWIGGVLFIAVRKVWFARRVFAALRILPKKKAADILEGLGYEEPAKDSAASLPVIFTDIVNVPCLVGFRRAYILVPQEDYTREDLFYIIRHEMMHYERKDIYWNVLAEILCSFFWWNPAFSYLKKSIFHMSEVANDARLTEGMTEEERAEYMKCLVDATARMTDQAPPFGVSLGGSRPLRNLKQRLALIERRFSPNRALGAAAVVLSAMLLVSTYLISIEAYTPAPEGELMNAENTYLIKNGDVYDVYLNGKYLFTTDDRRPFKKVPVYKSKEDVKND